MALSQDEKDIRERQLHDIRIELINRLTGYRYKAIAKCSECKSSTEDIVTVRRLMKTDICPNCHHMFSTDFFLRVYNGTALTIPLLDKGDVIEQLPKVRRMPLSILKTGYAALYHSAIFYFGGLVAAFEAVNIKKTMILKYWKTRVDPFLGCLTDVEIARCVGVKPREISKLRKARGCSAFRMKNLDKYHKAHCK